MEKEIEQERAALQPRIFDALHIEEKVPEGFNAVKLALDGRLNAPLDWQPQLQAAAKYAKKGYKLFWELQLGLFEELTLPLSNRQQFLSLAISLDHFCQNIWSAFEDANLGVCLYRGSADFASNFDWEESRLENLQEWTRRNFPDFEQFRRKMLLPCSRWSELTPELLQKHPEGRNLLSHYCQGVAGDYLLSLSKGLRGNISAYLLLDASHIGSNLLKSRLLNRECYEPLKLAVCGSAWLEPQLAWNQGCSESGFISRKNLPLQNREAAKIGVYLPPIEYHSPSRYEGLESALDFLSKEMKPFRVIPESFLAAEWDGLDYLIYTSAGLAPDGKRQIQGFCAAGGTAVSLGPLMGFAYEIPFSEFRSKALRNFSE